MRKYKEENDTTFSGSKYCNIPSLVESLLKRFAKLSKQCSSALRQMAPQVLPTIPDHASTKPNLGSSDSMERKEKARQRQAAIMVRA
jgi:E3 ubiquitin-protein ligase UBR3